MMKKILCSLVFLGITFIGIAQSGLFKPVTAFPVPTNRLTATEGVTHKWEWRIDATLSVIETFKDKLTNTFVSETFNAVGIAIGYQRYVPTSTIDPTPKNTYGASFGIFPSDRLKFALQLNIWEYFKFGGTYTLNVSDTRSPLGFFVGMGLTF